jgi:hypothetical protein
VLWCEQWVNETNHCIERKRGPLILLGQVRPRIDWGEGGQCLAWYMLVMHELVGVGSLLIGKTWELDNRKLCESNACVTWDGNEIINNEYSLWFGLGRVAKCRKNKGMGVLREKEKWG